MLHYSITAEIRERTRQGWVGIWKPRLDDKGRRSWVRAQECITEWGLWSNAHTIPAKGNKPRIVLLGESVARGMLYDPYFTPAQVLSACLDAEVVDLARNGMSRDHLELVMEAVAVLDPDLVIIFAGNNWAEDGRPQDLDEARGAAEVLRQGGVPAFKQQIEATLQDRARQTVARITELGALAGIPLLWIVPTANYEGWQFSEATVPALDGGNNAQWLRKQQIATQLLQDSKYEQALQVALEMMELDQGTAATSALLAARSELGLGHDEAARDWFRTAADAQSWDLTPQNPRILSCVREAMLAGTAINGAMVVDSDEILSGASDFLDYCHFTSDGISKVCRKAAELAATRLGIPMVQREQLQGLTAEPEIESRARFLAAIHAAHYGQPVETFRAYLDDAIRCWPGIDWSMNELLKLHAKQSPAWLCAELEALIGPDQKNLGRYLRLYAATDFIKLFDARLLNEIRLVLLERDCLDFDLDAARIREDGIKCGEPVNLLLPRYAPSFSHPDWWWWSAVDTRQEPRHHYLVAHTPVSAFTFVAESGQPLQASLVARLAGGAERGRCLLSLNGRELTSLDLGNTWTLFDIRLPREQVKTGVNELSIDWPEFDGDMGSLIERAARELEEGNYPELLCERATVHSLIVSEK